MEFPRLSGPVALDLETVDPQLKTHGPGWPTKNGKIVGVAIATKEWERYYPMRHTDGNNLNPDHVLDWLEDELPNTTRVYTHNGMYDAGWLIAEDVKFPLEKLHDTQALAALTDENRASYSLDNVAREELGVGKDESELNEIAKRMGIRNPKTAMDRMPSDVVGRYARIDGRRTFDLAEHFEAQVQAEDLGGIFRLEMDLLPVLIAMRGRGVRVDVAKADQQRGIMQRRAKDIASDIYRQTGVRVESFWNADQLATLFDSVGLEYGRTAKTDRPSFTKEWFEDVNHPIANLAREVRQIEKGVNTFLDAILALNINGRVYPELLPLPSEDGGAVTGRFSSCNPNIQQLPSRVPWLKKLIRSLFLPEEGQLWAANDYSQQEPRMAVHFATLAGLRGAAETAQAYHDNPDLDFHAFVAELTGLPRDQAKIINLALMYRMGGGKLCRSLGLPVRMYERQGKLIEVAGDEGQAILNQYHARLPFMKALSDECERRAKRRGYIKTLLGRRCRFQSDRWDTLPDGTKKLVKTRGRWPYKAMNSLIQGSSADQTKRAMIEIHRAGHWLLAAVHDETGNSVRDKGEAEQIAEIMREVTPLKVPMKVDVEVGPSWGEAA